MEEKKGWICPRCGRSNAYWLPHCNCNPKNYNSDDYKWTCETNN